MCVGCTADGQCDDGDVCTGVEACVSGSCLSGTPIDCSDGDECTSDTCDPGTGACSNTPLDCDDAIACTFDFCEVVIVSEDPFTVEAVCRHDPDNSLCDTGLFCQAGRCDPQTGCALGNECVSAVGNPCEDPALCDEAADSCGLCLTPSVSTSGCRYLAITPGDMGATLQALLVVGYCNDAQVACVSKFVQPVCVEGLDAGLDCMSDADCPLACDGGLTSGEACTVDSDCLPLDSGFKCSGRCSGARLSAVPVYRTAAEWGLVQVSDEELRPDTLYRVHASCESGGGDILSAAPDVKTRVWGDVTGDGLVNVVDITAGVDRIA